MSIKDRYKNFMNQNGVQQQDNSFSYTNTKNNGLSERYRQFQSQQDVLSEIDTDIFKETSPLSTWQNIMLSFAPNDQQRLKYLVKEFGGRVSYDPEQGFMVDNRKVNPKGLDIGDLSRNAGYAPNLAGQILLGIKGATVGAAIGGPIGAAIGTVSGGILGDLTGEGVRLFISKSLDFDVDEKTVWDNLIDEAKISAAGEILGLGLAGAGRVVGGAAKKGVGYLSKTPIFKSIGGIWQKSIKKLGGYAPEVLRFVGEIPEDASRIAVLKYKPSQVLNDEYFDSRKIIDIAKNTLFGNDPKVKKLALSEFGLTGKSGMSKGNEFILRSIKEKDNEGLIRLIKFFSNLDDETILKIKNTPENLLLKSSNLSDQTPFNLAEKFVESVNDRRKVLSREIGKQIRKYTKDKTAPSFFTGDLAKEIKTIMNDNSFISGINETGWAKKDPLSVPGMKNLKDLVDLFYGVRTKPILDPIDKHVIFEVTGKKEPFFFLTKRNVVKLNNQMDVIMDTINRNQNVPVQIKMAASKIRNSFKDKFYSQSNLGGSISKFRNFADLTDDIVTNGKSALVKYERIFKNFDSVPIGEKRVIFEAINGIPNVAGDFIKNNLDLFSTMNKFNKSINSEKILNSFVKGLDNYNFLSTIKENTTEAILRDFDSIIRTSKNSNIKNRMFVDEAEKAIAAKEFLKSGTNILRVSTIAGMVGLGAFFGGPVGAFAGLVAARATNPRNIARFLVGAENIGKKTSRVTGKIKPLTSKQKSLISAVLRSYAGRQVQKPSSRISSY